MDITWSLARTLPVVLLWFTDDKKRRKLWNAMRTAQQSKSFLLRLDFLLREDTEDREQESKYYLTLHFYERSDKQKVLDFIQGYCIVNGWNEQEMSMVSDELARQYALLS